MPACWIYKSNLTECNLWSVLSLWLLFLVRNVIVQEVQKLRPFEACSPLPAVDWTSIIPGVSADAEGVISRGERRTCKSNCFNPLKHLSSFSRGKLGVQQRSSEPWSWLERKTKPVAEELYDAPWLANCAVRVWMAGLSNWQIFFKMSEIETSLVKVSHYLQSFIQSFYVSISPFLPQTQKRL